MSIGINLRTIRKQKNLTMRELAEKAGISSSYISDLENGKTNNPSFKIISKLCDALCIDLDKFYNYGEDINNVYENCNNFVELKKLFFNKDCDLSKFSSEAQEILGRYVKLIERKGKVVKHFKGNLYLVLDVAFDVNTDDECVIYKALYGEMKLFTRPVSNFLSKIDENNYRFEFIDLQ